MKLIPETVSASWTAFDPSTEPDQTLLDVLDEVCTGLNVLTGVQLRVLAEVDARALARDLGHGSTKDFFSRGARTNPGEAKRALDLAASLRRFPATAALLASGDINAAHARAVVEAMAWIDDACKDLAEIHRLAAEQELLNVALSGTPNQVTERGKELLLGLADPVLDANAGEDTSRNKFDVSAGKAGRVRISGNVDSVLGEKLLTALSPVSKPVPGPLGEKDERSPSLRRADGLGAIVDGYLGSGVGPQEGGVKPHLVLHVSGRDLAGEGEFAHGVHDTDCAQSSGHSDGDIASDGADDRVDLDDCDDDVRYGRREESEPPNPFLDDDDAGSYLSGEIRGGGAANLGYDNRGRCTDRQTKSGSGAHAGTADGPQAQCRACDRGTYARLFAAPTPFRLEWLGPISRSSALLIACDCAITRIVLDDEGVPMWLGRAERVVPAGLRRALVARDRGCTLCGAPASWCRAHHVVFWGAGGPTDLDNLCLLCDRCHRMVHAGIWEIVFGADGHPWFRPPRKRDPDRILVPGFFRQPWPTPQTV